MAGTLIATRGLPGSGKSSWVVEQLQNDGVVRVEADLLRRMLHGEQWVARYEPMVHQIKMSCITELLAETPKGIHTVIDDECNLGSIAHLENLAAMYGWEFRVADFRDVSAEECIRRDSLRPEGKRVGPDVIMGMVNKYGMGKKPD